jgi:hypothetical protein
VRRTVGGEVSFECYYGWLQKKSERVGAKERVWRLYIFRHTRTIHMMFDGLCYR